MIWLARIRSFYQSHQQGFDYAFIFLLSFLCYGLLIPFLGFYWDDLPYLYQLSTFGPSGFPEYVASDRPFSAWIFMLTTWLFRFQPLGYHLLALILRFAATIIFYAILKQLWPEKHAFRLFSAAIFVVYPGFLQQPIALIYNHHLSVLCLFLGSLFFMLKYVLSEKRQPVLYGLSIIMSFHIFSIENFALLELIRPVLLWLALSGKTEKSSDRVKKVIFIWLPYLLVFLLFFIWRVFIFKFPTYEPGLLQSLAIDPLAALAGLIQRIPQDFFTVTVGAWLESFTIPSISGFGIAATYLLWALVAGTFLLSIAFFTNIATRNNTTKKPILSILVVGFSLFILGAALIWVLELPLRIDFAWDRMTIGLIPGLAILIGLAGELIHRRSKWLGSVSIGILIAFAVGSHFENGMRYKRDWENLQSLFQQLAWRMPALDGQTALLTSDPGLTYYSDNSLTSPLNLTYSQDNNGYDLEHFLFFTDVRLGLALPELSRDISISQGYRNFIFTGNTSQMVAFKNDPPACLKVMDRIYSNSITNLNLTDLQTEELRLTNLDVIRNSPQHLPPSFIVKDLDPNNWCYFFQKADLARQLGSYQEIAVLGDRVMETSLRPREASEWLPFLEGYCWLGQWDRVDMILDEIFAIDPDYQSGVCYTVRRIRNTPEFPFPEKLSEIINAYNCQ